jgi:hypothetical protein
MLQMKVQFHMGNLSTTQYHWHRTHRIYGPQSTTHWLPTIQITSNVPLKFMSIRQTQHTQSDVYFVSLVKRTNSKKLYLVSKCLTVKVFLDSKKQDVTQLDSCHFQWSHRPKRYSSLHAKMSVFKTAVMKILNNQPALQKHKDNHDSDTVH